VTVPVNVGLAVKATVPVPDSSVRAAAKLAEVGVARNVATPVPRPEIPVDTGRPVAFVSVIAEGVPRFGVVRVRPAIVVTVEPRATEVEPIVAEALASIVLVTEAVSPVVTTVPVTAGRVIVVAPAVAAALKIVEPEVEPLMVIPAPAMLDDVRVRPVTPVIVEPRATEVEPIVTDEFASLALAIEPRSMLLVTVPVSPEVITVPEVAGNAIAVVPAIGAPVIVVVPEVVPGRVKLVPNAGLVSVRPAIVVTVEPRATEVEPIVADELASLELAIEPASIAFVTVEVSPVVTTFPVTGGSVSVLVPAVALATTVMVPEVEPLKFAPVPPNVGKVSVRPATVVVAEPRVRVLDPRVMVEFASLLFGIVPEMSLLVTPPPTRCFSQAEPL
jgi:thiamine phosphate synthase YjbQ (UPF0047 family)